MVKQVINLGNMVGGLGDHIASLPAIRYVVKNYGDTQYFNVVYPDYFISLAKVLLPEIEGTLKYISYSELRDPDSAYCADAPARDTLHRGGHGSMKTHLTDFAFHRLADKHEPDIFEKRLPRYWASGNSDYIIVTTGYTAPVRAMPTETINELLAYIKSRQRTPLLLGNLNTVTGKPGDNINAKFPDGIDTTDCHDLRNKTTLVEAVEIIGQARAIVGLDNGLLWLAGCTGTPVVAGYTNVEPKTRVPYAAFQPWKIVQNKACNRCQYTIDFNYSADFRACPVHPEDAMTCSKGIEPQQYIDALKELGV